MKETPLHGNKLLADVEDFLKTGMNYFEVSGTQKIIEGTSRVFLFFTVLILTCILLLALAFGIAWWVGNKVNNYVLGFLFVAVLMITLFSFFTIFQNSFLRFTRNKFVSIIYH